MGWRVGIAGAQRWALQGLAQALQRAGCEAIVLASLDPLPPLDVLLLAPADPQAARQLAARVPPQLPLLWLGDAPDTMRSAATGQLSPEASDEAIVAAINALAHGLHVNDAARPAATRTIAELSEPLTPRELEVLELMAKGLANRDIALALGISSHTAKFHVAQILEKAGAATRTEAVRQGLRLGLIGL